MRILKKFIKNIKGNVSIAFAISAVPMVAVMGAGLDYAKGQQVNAHFQNMVDSAALAAAASQSESISELEAIVGDYISRNMKAKGKLSTPVVKVTKLEDGKLKVTIKSTLETSLIRVIGIDSFEVKAKSIVTREFGNVDVALVLDNTGSMSGSRLTALKSAARDLVNTMHDAKSEDSVMRVGIVPFSDYVNIGLSRRNASWADIPDDVNRRERRYRWNYRWTRYNCRWKYRSGYWYWRDGRRFYRSGYRYRSCQWRRGARYRQAYWHYTRSIWYGCVASRNHPYNTQDIRSDLKIPGVMNRRCSRELTPLTADKDAIIREIGRMNASGSTYIPAGLMWGWRVVSNAQPINASDGLSDDHDDDGSDDFDTGGTAKVNKSIVLMTDGENTRSPRYAQKDHQGSSRSTSDRLTAEICRNIKASSDEITIYTVAFEVTDNATKNMLRSCATSPSHYFDATNSAKLAEAFEKIAKSLALLRISQ